MVQGQGVVERRVVHFDQQLRELVAIQGVGQRDVPRVQACMHTEVLNELTCVVALGSERINAASSSFA